MKKLFLILLSLSLAREIYCQKKYEDYSRAKDSVRYGPGKNDIFPPGSKGFTLMVPEKDIKGIILVLDDDRPNLSDTAAIYQPALANGFATLYISTGIPLDFYFSERSSAFVDSLAKEVFSKYQLPNKNIFLVGAMMSGHRALKYIEYCKKGRSLFNPSIKGVVLCESAIDWVRQWYECQKQVRDHISPTGFFEGNLITYLFAQNLKTTPARDIFKFIDFSPYSYFDTKMEKPKLYKDLAIRAYTFADISYWFSAQGKGIYDSNYPDMSGFINEQALLGNKKASLIAFSSSLDDPLKNDMRRQSATWNLIDKNELMGWMSKMSDPAAGEKLSVTDMKADLKVLFSAIKELHPGYGLYYAADSIDESYRTLFSTVTDPMYESEFISRVYPFLCTLGCGHTQLRHSANYQAPGGITVSHLPFEVLVHHRRAWVTARKTAKLSAGDEIISINDEPVSAIIQNGSALYCGDGHVESFKELYLSEYDGFEDVCRIHYKWASPYRVSIRTNKGILKTVVLDPTDTVPPVNTASFDKYASWMKAKSNDDLALYFLKQGDAALFEVKGLQYADTAAYSEYFKQIAQKGSKNLILDLRHNGGGDIRIVIKLLSYLADSSFAIIKDLRSRVQDPSVNSLAAHFDPQRTESFKGSCIPARQEKNEWHVNVYPNFARPFGPNPVARSGRFRG